jgi:glucose/arabinose dehydrogenase
VRQIAAIVCVAIAAACSSSSHRSSGPTGAAAPSIVATGAGVTLTEVARLAGPVALAYRSGDTAPWVVEQHGTVQRVFGGKATMTVDLRKEVDTDGNERGLLGIAFSADGSTLFLDATVKPHADTRVWSFPVSADGTVDTAHRTTLLEQHQPYANHNGGNLVIGPDHLLYVSLGDGGSAGDPQRHGQDLGTDLGKILRLDPTKTAPFVPGDNPFVGRDGAQGNIWLYGVRNPWRFSFDQANGDLWIGDVGQDKYEEVDHLKATGGIDAGKGANLGWSASEGNHPFNTDQKAPGAIAPTYEYSHDVGCSITGGYVYRGTAIPSLVGRYVYSDYCAGGIWALSTDGKTSTQLLGEPKSVSSFGQDPKGELSVMSTSGGLYRLS